MTKPKNVTQSRDYIYDVFNQHKEGFVARYTPDDPLKQTKRSIRQSKKAAKESRVQVREINAAAKKPKVKIERPKAPKGYTVGKETKYGTITKRYSDKSRVVKKQKDQHAVEMERKISKGKGTVTEKIKGYISKKRFTITNLKGETIVLKGKGVFTGVTDYEKMVYSLDKAVDPSSMRFSMALAAMNDRDRAKLNARVQEVDWNKFWKDKERYDPNKGGIGGEGEDILRYLFNGLMAPEEINIPLAAISDSPYMR